MSKQCNIYEVERVSESSCTNEKNNSEGMDIIILNFMDDPVM